MKNNLLFVLLPVLLAAVPLGAQNRPCQVLTTRGDSISGFLLNQSARELTIREASTGKERVLIEDVDNGHTLDVVDFDGDGHLDIFNAEMRFGEGNPDAEVRILLGDGKGGFTKHVVARGFGVHEGRLVDLDGDGDLDVLGKPYSWQAPRLDIWINETPRRRR